MNKEKLGPHGLRLFVAVDVDEKCREAVARLVGALKTCGAGVKWVAADNLHYTLKFLGETELDPGKIAGALKTVRPGKFDLELRGVGCFPNAKAPRVVYVGAGAGGESLKLLAEAVETSLEPLGFEREKRGFTSHLTIGRVKIPGKVSLKLAEKMNGQEGAIFGKFSVDRFFLMKSDLRSGGPVYSRMAEFQL
ncbi:MAG: RNA 2',3'-cyclic phosphodiesterase [Nitrospinae bacterium]|nr:RNA 2',3'-cyclic phosphodiesterase [Nitrospinota bacterium]